MGPEIWHFRHFREGDVMRLRNVRNKANFLGAAARARVGQGFVELTRDGLVIQAAQAGFVLTELIEMRALVR